MSANAMTNHYETLGVSVHADYATIHAAWRRRIAAVHPDRARGNADEAVRTAKAARLNAAWSVLSDPARRAMYDLDLLSVTPRPAATSETAVPDNQYARAYDRAYAAPAVGEAFGQNFFWPSAAVFQAAGVGGFVVMGAMLTTFVTLPLALPLALVAGAMGVLSLGAASLRGDPATA